MKWIRVDTDAPDDLKIKLLLGRGASLAANGAQAWAGAIWLLWCHVGAKGKGLPGEGVRANGEPLDPLEMAVACHFAGVAELEAFLAACADVRLIDPTRWAVDHVVFLPAMASRADEYSKKKARKLAKGETGGEPEDQGKGPDTSAEVSGHYPPKPGIPVCTVGALDLDQLPEPATPDPEHDAALPLGGVGQVERLVEVWNTTAAPALPRIAKVNGERQRAYTRALREHPNLAEWSAAIAFLNASRWWLGQDRPATGNGSAWIGNLDYLAKPGKLQSVTERVAARQAGQAGRPGAIAGSVGYVVDAARGRVRGAPGRYAEAEAADDGTN